LVGWHYFGYFSTGEAVSFGIKGFVLIMYGGLGFGGDVVHFFGGIRLIDRGVNFFGK
jgi:hypothetical protein